MRGLGAMLANNVIDGQENVVIGMAMLAILILCAYLAEQGYL